MRFFHQFQVVGRGVPTESGKQPKIYCMKLWATFEVRAKSEFWLFTVTYFLYFRSSDTRRTSVFMVLTLKIYRHYCCRHFWAVIC
ncbi:putative ribosomal protein 50S-L18Ae/60S-L20/60S-L18A [Helianthus annuus]|nr:putative ribosomal protein 50S-L18Ae/60S-L20/60S-L18A [Helianthus annuus]